MLNASTPAAKEHLRKVQMLQQIMPVQGKLPMFMDLGEKYDLFGMKIKSYHYVPTSNTPSELGLAAEKPGELPASPKAMPLFTFKDEEEGEERDVNNMEDELLEAKSVENVTLQDVDDNTRTSGLSVSKGT